MKGMFTELVYVLKTLDKSTHIKLLIMVIITVLMSIFFFTTIENPVIEKWKDNRETEQVFEQRNQDKEDSKEDEKGTEEPVY